MAQTKKNADSSKNTKRKPQKRKSKVKLSKGKVYIAPYKIIILCAAIIIVCMTLLLITTLAASPKNEDQISISKRYEQTESSKTPEETKNLKRPYENSKNETSSKTEKTEQANKSQKNNKSTKTEKNDKNAKPQQNKTTSVPVKTENITKEPAKPQSTPTSATSSEKKSAATGPQTSYNNRENQAADSKKTVTEKNTETQKIAAEKPAITKSFGFPQAKNGAQLIFVFDDGGQNLAHLEKFMSMPFPFTVAVLPQLAHSAESAARVRKAGKEVILHQPMQSVNPKVNPGPGAITPSMNENQIKTILFQNINEISPVAGLNNHEGSGITADAEKMEVVLKVAAENSIYFLDSRTNVETKVPEVAAALGYSYYERNIFLDNEKTRDNVLQELNKGITLANKNGSVVMIGHIWSADFLPAILMEAYPELVQKGYTFSVVSKSKAKKN